MRNSILSVSLALVIVTLASCKDNVPQATQTGNPVVESIMARRSVRHYTDEKVPRELLQKIAECGINAPNAMNAQEWEVRIVDDDSFLAGATEVLKETIPALVGENDPKFRNGFRNATALIAVACPEDESGMSLINVGLLCENICLAAQSYGLGSVIMGGPVGVMNTHPGLKPYLDRLAFSEGYKLRILIGLGYPDESPAARPRDVQKIKFAD